MRINVVFHIPCHILLTLSTCSLFSFYYSFLSLQPSPPLPPYLASAQHVSSNTFNWLQEQVEESPLVEKLYQQLMGLSTVLHSSSVLPVIESIDGEISNFARNLIEAEPPPFKHQVTGKSLNTRTAKALRRNFRKIEKMRAKNPALPNEMHIDELYAGVTNKLLLETYYKCMDYTGYPALKPSPSEPVSGGAVGQKDHGRSWDVDSDSVGEQSDANTSGNHEPCEALLQAGGLSSQCILPEKDEIIMKKKFGVMYEEYVTRYNLGDPSRFVEGLSTNINDFIGKWQIIQANGRSDPTEDILKSLGVGAIKRRIASAHDSITEISIFGCYDSDIPVLELATHFPLNIVKRISLRLDCSPQEIMDNDTGNWMQETCFFNGRLFQKRYGDKGVMYDVRSVYRKDPLGIELSPVQFFQTLDRLQIPCQKYFVVFPVLTKALHVKMYAESFFFQWAFFPAGDEPPIISLRWLRQL